jgi:hypothetical protein
MSVIRVQETSVEVTIGREFGEVTIPKRELSDLLCRLQEVQRRDEQLAGKPKKTKLKP